MAPAGGTEQVEPLFFPADVFTAEVSGNAVPFVENGINRICLCERGGQAVFSGFILFGGQFGLKGAKELVPDDKEHTHILVQVSGVRGVMDAVMGGGDEDIFQPAHFADQFGMDEDAPDLGGGVHKYDIERFESQEGEWDEIDEAVEGLEDGGPESNGEVHVFGGVVGDMDCPEKSYFVVPAVQPVIEEIFSEQQEEPVGEDVGNREVMVPVAILKDEQIGSAEQEVDSPIQQHKIEVGQCIFPGVQFAMSVIAEQHFYSDDNEIERRAYQDQQLFSEGVHG